MLFICPKCKTKFTISPDGRAICENGHSFDRAKEGYYNLLFKNNGGTHGDNREMVLARRAFLESGAYEPLAQKILDRVSGFAKSGDNILDGGCGEGYYTDLIERGLKVLGIDAHVSGFDISRDAVRYASKKNRALSLVVASSYDMPLSDGSVDLFINVFSPLALSETARVVRPGGRFIMAIPNRRHLFGLKSVLYERPYENTVEDSALEGFTLIAEDKVSYELTLDTKDAIRSLFMMTPYAYRTPKSAGERLLSMTSLTTEIEFIVFTYERNK
ncbi:MAG: methyltransferase domain-containing protein [Clostridia bacterium]|nr:methyltransferase domain-containing protein [Clostridia bacterium]